MPLNSNQSKELSLHLVKRFGISVLEIPKRLPKPKYVCPPEWTKDNSKWIELPVAAEMMKRQPSQRKPPAFTL